MHTTRSTLSLVQSDYFQCIVLYVSLSHSLSLSSDILVTTCFALSISTCMFNNGAT